MIKDTLQRTVEMWFSCDGMFDHNIRPITNLLLSPFLNFLEVTQHLANLWGGVLIASSALCAGALYCWKTKNSLEIDIMAVRNCCNSITLRLILLTNLDSVIDKYQAGLMPTTCNSPTDVISDWTLVICAGILSRRPLPGWWMCVQSVILWVFRCGHCKYLFLPVQWTNRC